MYCYFERGKTSIWMNKININGGVAGISLLQLHIEDQGLWPGPYQKPSLAGSGGVP